MDIFVLFLLFLDLFVLFLLFLDLFVHFRRIKGRASLTQLDSLWKAAHFAYESSSFCLREKSPTGKIESNRKYYFVGYLVMRL